MKDWFIEAHKPLTDIEKSIKDNLINAKIKRLATITSHFSEISPIFLSDFLTFLRLNNVYPTGYFKFHPYLKKYNFESYRQILSTNEKVYPDNIFTNTFDILDTIDHFMEDVAIICIPAHTTSPIYCDRGRSDFLCRLYIPLSESTNCGIKGYYSELPKSFFGGIYTEEEHAEASETVGKLLGFGANPMVVTGRTKHNIINGTNEFFYVMMLLINLKFVY